MECTDQATVHWRNNDDLNSVSDNAGLSDICCKKFLISYANGLQRLAIFPSSTVQILGAEKALFRSKKQGCPPPKHGIIFQHPYINKANRSERGKIARVLAAKISTAAKADAFTKRNLSNDLKLELEIRLNEIKNP